jgi:alpha-D-ribose 1-methylphosphonate 5-triphosphate synthase subunit PhnL
MQHGVWAPDTIKVTPSVYRLVVLDGSRENGKATLARAVFCKEMPTGGEIVIKFRSIKSEELAASVAAVCCQHKITSIIAVAKLCA